jgi:hypothetical protein
MDIVAEIISDPRYKDFIKGIWKELRSEEDQKEISELEARQLLSVKGKIPTDRTMRNYREKGVNVNRKDSLPYIPGKPVTYIKKDVVDWKARNLVVKRNRENIY